MNASERRELILTQLSGADKPISASALAEECHVSRQLIVGDVAMLRATGHDIIATPRGYILGNSADEGVLCRMACRHNAEQMQEELNAIVDQGCHVVDVMVDHPLYGQLTGHLDLKSRYDVQAFIDKAQSADAQPISVLTAGIHLHTVRCPDEAACVRVRQALAALGVLVE